MAEKLITVIGPADIVRHTEASNAGNLPEGFRVATPAEEAKAQAEARGVTLEGAAETVGAAAAGVARGTTGGVSDYVQTQLPGGMGIVPVLRGEDTPEAKREVLRRWKAESPYASMGGEIAGSVYGLGKARAVAGAIPGVARLGAPTSRLGRVALGTGIGTLEGGAVGAQQAITESVLADSDLTGERLWASVGHGALWGGAISGAMSGTGQLIGAGLGRIRRARVQSPTAAGVDAVADGAFGEAAPGLGQKFADAIKHRVADTAEMMGTGGREEIMGLMSSPRARELMLKGAGQIDDISRQYTKDFTGLLEHSDAGLASIKQAPVKHSKVARLVGNVDETAAAESFGSWQKAVEETVEDILGNKELYYTKNNLPLLAKAARVIRMETAEAVHKATTANARKAHYFVGGDRLKRELGTYTKSFQKLAKNKPTIALRKTADRLDDLYHTGQQSLENAGVWGAAGLAQKRLNRGISANIAAGEVFHRALTTKGTTRSLADPWRNVQVVDPSKADSFIRSMTQPKTDLVYKAQHEWMSTLDDTAEALLELHDPTGAQLSALNKMRSSTTRLRRTLTENEEVITRANQIKSIEDATRNADIGLMSRVPFVGSPARTIRHLAAVESVAGRAKSKTDGSLTRFFKGAAKRGEGWAAKAKRAKRPLMTAATAASARQRYDWQAEQVQQIAANRGAVQRSLEEGFGELAHGAPETIASSVAAANRSIDHLLKHLPVQPLDGYPLAGGKPRAASPIDMDRWLSRAKALEDPSTLLDDAADGTMTPDALDAVKEVYPTTFRDMQDQLMDGLMDMAAEGKSLPYHQLLGASTLLGQPLDPTQDPELVARTQAVYAATPQREPRKGGSPPHGDGPDISKFYRSQTDRIEDQKV